MLYKFPFKHIKPHEIPWRTHAKPWKTTIKSPWVVSCRVSPQLEVPESWLPPADANTGSLERSELGLEALRLT
jgi:hypothetical protein